MKLELINSDKRGEINIITELSQFSEVAIFTTKAGFARGGCIHGINCEYVCVLEGVIKYIQGENKVETIMYPGTSIAIPKATPHYFLSITNSTVAEWGATPAEKQFKHKEFRAIVDRLNQVKERKEMK